MADTTNPPWHDPITSRLQRRGATTSRSMRTPRKAAWVGEPIVDRGRRPSALLKPTSAYAMSRTSRKPARHGRKSDHDLRQSFKFGVPGRRRMGVASARRPPRRRGRDGCGQARPSARPAALMAYSVIQAFVGSSSRSSAQRLLPLRWAQWLSEPPRTTIAPVSSRSKTLPTSFSGTKLSIAANQISTRCLVGRLCGTREMATMAG